jgi:hypothetical protein
MCQTKPKKKKKIATTWELLLGSQGSSSHRPYLDTLIQLELELISNSNTNLKLTLVLEVFG